ncbi:MAG: TonB-dependent siderophore receptor [Cyanobacteria bacterium P01_E01_bin.42]
MMLFPKKALPILLISSVAASSSIVLPISHTTNANAQEAVSQAAIAQITDIRFQPSEGGLDLILETRNGDNIQAFSDIDGNTLLLDLVGVQLDIDAERYLADNPTDAVSSLIVETVDEQTVRIRIAGIETLPEANLAIAGDEFIVSLPGASTLVETPTPEEPNLAAPSEATSDIAEITNIRLQSISSGAELLLETSNGDAIQPFSTVEGNTLILDLVNARLALPEGDRYSIENPIEEASSLTVETLDSQSIRLTIVGIETLPEANLSITGEEFIVDIPSAAAIARSQDSLQTSDSGTLRIGVTGQEEDYTVDNATTATRTDTLLRDIPQSVQVIPKQVLEDQQILDLSDAVRNVSGVQFGEADPRGQRFILRGFNSSSVLRNGFPLTFGSQGNIGYQELTNIERVEVLKGPASILFGVVEPGGVINLVTEQPQTEQATELGLIGGSRGLFSSTLDITGPFSSDERSLYRVNALYSREDYYRDFDTPVQRFFIAPVLSFAPNDNTDIDISFEYVDEERPADFGIPAFGTGVVDVPSTRIIGEPDDRATVNSTRFDYNLEHRFSDDWKIRNAFSYSRFDTILEYAFSSLALGGFNETTGIVTRNFIYLEQPSDTYTVQTNLVGEFNTGDVEHTLLFGFDFFRREEIGSVGRVDLVSSFLDIFNPVYGQATRPNVEDMLLSLDQDGEINNWGFYLQDQIAFTDDLKVLIGGRYDTVRRRSIARPTFLNPTGSDTTTTEDAFSPRFGLVYQPIEELSLYASYSQSFSPNLNTTVDGDLIDPERGEQFEVGARAELLDGDVILNLAYFDLTKQNIATSDPSNPGFFIATGEQRSQGIELDIIGEIVPGWNVVANYAYTNARTTEDDTIPTGNKLAGVPDNSANFWTTYEFQSGDLEGLSLGIGFNAVGERQGDDNNSFAVDGYFLTNAAIAYRRDNWRIDLNFRNIFDVDYIEGTSSRLQVQPGRGFTAIGSFAIEF